MSSRKSALLLTLLVIAPLLACGHKGSPKPPPQRIPAPVRDLMVTQRGEEMLVRFTYPQMTISGLPLEDVVAIEVWEYDLPVPEFSASALGDDEETEEGEEDEAQATEDDAEGEPEDSGDESASEEPDAEEGGSEDEDEDEDEDDNQLLVQTPTKESLLELDPREFDGASRLAKRLTGVELTDAIRGDRVHLRLQLDEIEPGEKMAKVYGVKTFQTLKRVSALSNLVKIIPRVPPPAPTDMAAEATGSGVRLTWTFEGEEPEQFRFYRRDELTPIYGDVLGMRDGDEERFLDATATFGSKYHYVMTAVTNVDPLVESVLSAEISTEFLDDFPPEAPSDLVILPDVGSARLLWEGNDDEVIGYFVYRRGTTGSFQRVHRAPVRATEFSDTTAASGRSYTYRITAVDSEGNESEPSDEVEVRIP